MKAKKHLEFNREVTARINEVVDIIGTQVKAGKSAVISPRQIRAYLAGASMPTYPTVVLLTEAAGISHEYMATGKGPKFQKSQTRDFAKQATKATEQYLILMADLLKKSQATTRRTTQPSNTDALLFLQLRLKTLLEEESVGFPDNRVYSVKNIEADLKLIEELLEAQS